MIKFHANKRLSVTILAILMLSWLIMNMVSSVYVISQLIHTPYLLKLTITLAWMFCYEICILAVWDFFINLFNIFKNRC